MMTMLCHSLSLQHVIFLPILIFIHSFFSWQLAWYLALMSVTRTLHFFLKREKRRQKEYSSRIYANFINFNETQAQKIVYFCMQLKLYVQRRSVITCLSYVLSAQFPFKRDSVNWEWLKLSDIPVSYELSCLLLLVRHSICIFFFTSFNVVYCMPSTFFTITKPGRNLIMSWMWCTIAWMYQIENVKGQL